MIGAGSRLQRQRGVITLFLSLVMLVVITGIVIAAFTMSTTNLRSVGNLQWRNEAIAAANVALEDQISSDFTALPSAVSIPVDLNNDTFPDYTVSIGVPQCVRAAKVTTDVYSSVTLPVGLSSSTQWNTVWEFVANVTDATTGTSVSVRTAARVLLSQAKKSAVCA